MICFCGNATEKGYRRLFNGVLGKKGNIFLCDECEDMTRYVEGYISKVRTKP